MGNLCTLTLTECHNPLFTALNPGKNLVWVILFLWITELTPHIHLEKRFCLKELWEILGAPEALGPTRNGW